MANNDKVTLKTIFDSVEGLRTEVRQTYVTKDEFRPVKSIAYGAVGMAAMAVLTALLTKVVIAIGI